MNVIVLGFLASLGAGLLTAVGAVPVLFGPLAPRDTSVHLQSRKLSRCPAPNKPFS
jgi:hypothetical protein